MAILVFFDGCSPSHVTDCVSGFDKHSKASLGLFLFLVLWRMLGLFCAIRICVLLLCHSGLGSPGILNRSSAYSVVESHEEHHAVLFLCRQAPTEIACRLFRPLRLRFSYRREYEGNDSLSLELTCVGFQNVVPVAQSVPFVTADLVD